MQNRIRELRKQNSMTLIDLGKVLGVAESTVSQYETGKREPSNEMLLRLAEFFNVSVDFFIIFADLKSIPNPRFPPPPPPNSYKNAADKRNLNITNIYTIHSTT